jgi:hypothetical protein
MIEEGQTIKTRTEKKREEMNDGRKEQNEREKKCAFRACMYLLTGSDVRDSPRQLSFHRQQTERTSGTSNYCRKQRSVGIRQTLSFCESIKSGWCRRTGRTKLHIPVKKLLKLKEVGFSPT